MQASWEPDWVSLHQNPVTMCQFRDLSDNGGVGREVLQIMAAVLTNLGNFQAELVLLRLLVSHYRQSLEAGLIFQDVYGYPPQTRAEGEVAQNLAKIRRHFMTLVLPEASELRGYGLMGVYLLTGALPGDLRVDRGEILWRRSDVSPTVAEVIDLALYCRQRDRLTTAQQILHRLQNHLKAPPQPERLELVENPWTKPAIAGGLLIGASFGAGILVARSPLFTPAASQPQIPTKANSERPTPLTPPSRPSVAASPSFSPSRLQQAKVTATEAVQMGRAASPDWSAAAQKWQQAIAQMQAVPATDPDYRQAQQKVAEYQGYLQEVQRQYFLSGMKIAQEAVAAQGNWPRASQLWQQAVNQMQAVPQGHPDYTTAQAKAKEYDRYLQATRAKANQRGQFQLLRVIQGEISPKSIVYARAGLFFAQNMMYRHTVTVYDRSYRLVKTISDRVNLTSLGYKDYPGSYQGSPVEAADSHGGKYLWVSNYQMYGPGFNNPGQDVCSVTNRHDPSFVYRINTDSLEIDRAVQVGAVPKFLAVTPDDRLLLVSNWCSWDLSIVNLAKNQETQRVNLGAYPRGIAIDSKSSLAYVAVMGSLDIAVVNLQQPQFPVTWLRGVGNAPRHVLLDPSDRYLYVSFNGDGQIGKIDLQTNQVLSKLSTGKAPRSMALSRDGRFLYVVNYNSQTVSKVRTSDMQVVASQPVDPQPIGITYDPETNQVWVACYSGSIWVFQD
jgi:YVTN family beta-propeller protein